MYLTEKSLEDHRSPFASRASSSLSISFSVFTLQPFSRLTPTPPPKTRSSTFPAEETDWEVAATDLAGVAQEVPVVLEVLGQEQEGLDG